MELASLLDEGEFMFGPSSVRRRLLALDCPRLAPLPPSCAVPLILCRGGEAIFLSSFDARFFYVSMRLHSLIATIFEHLQDIQAFMRHCANSTTRNSSNAGTRAGAWSAVKKCQQRNG